MAAAARRGIPLSVVRGQRLPSDPWTARDWALQRAVDMLDALRCSGCGQPRWLSHDKAHRRSWEVSAQRCYACDAIAQRRDEMESGEARRTGALHYGTTLKR